MAATQKVRFATHVLLSIARARRRGRGALPLCCARDAPRTRLSGAHLPLASPARICSHSSPRNHRLVLYTVLRWKRERRGQGAPRSDTDACNAHPKPPLPRTSPSAALVPGAELESVAAAAAAAGRCVLDRLFWRVHEAGADVPRVPCAPLQGAAHRRARRAKNQAHVSRRVLQRRRRPTHAVERELGRGPPAAGLLHAAGARSQGPREVVDVLWPHAGAGRHAHQGARREHAGAGAKAGQGGRGRQYSCAGDARARRAAASHTAVALDCHLRRYHCSKLNCCNENPADVDRARKITRRIFRRIFLCGELQTC